MKEASNGIISKREHVELDSQGQIISAFLHRPSSSAGPLCPGVVLFHGLMASKSQPPHRLLVRLANALANVGIVALRIDFRGRGDSEGESVDVTPQGDLNDAQQALNYLMGRPDVDNTRLALLGISWGGAIAACLAERNPHVACIAMVSSVPVTGFDWQPEYTIVGGRQVVELWGNLLGREFYEELATIRPLQACIKAGRPVLILYGTDDHIISDNDISVARAALEEAQVSYDIIPVVDADHIFMHHAWTEAAIEQALKWLRRMLLQEVTE